MTTVRLARQVPVLVLIIMGCTSGASVRPHGPTTSDSRRVLGDELVATRELDLYGALSMCRPTFLHAREAMRGPPALYLDGVAMAEFDAIHAIALPDVTSVEFMSGPDATTRYGTGHVGGALLVWTKRGRGAR